LRRYCPCWATTSDDGVMRSARRGRTKRKLRPRKRQSCPVFFFFLIIKCFHFKTIDIDSPIDFLSEPSICSLAITWSQGNRIRMNDMRRELQKRKPLEGLRVLELGQLLAGPFAGVLLAWFGADVIKVEQPGVGDPLRKWREMHQDTALWWYILGRNKKSITLDLRHPKGQEIVRKLVTHVDVLLENFKPGTMEKWGLAYEDLKKLNPKLIMARVSGWGQTGPNARKAGFASVAEGVGGLRYVTGFPDRPPARPNLSLGDSLAGLHAALGIMIALYDRDIVGVGAGQVLDIAIYESVFNMMEGIVPEYDMCGVVREREGTKLSGIVPTGTYPCKGGKFIIIGGNSDSIFKRLMTAIGRFDMTNDARLEHNDGRVRHEQEIEDAITAWTLEHTFEDALKILEDADVPSGPIYSVVEMLKDPHFIARSLFETVILKDGSAVKLPRMVPQMSETPGGTKWVGPPLGAHTREVLQGILGVSETELEKFAEEGVIGDYVVTSEAE
jgi:formyl-CoA transferase